MAEGFGVAAERDDRDKVFGVGVLLKMVLDLVDRLNNANGLSAQSLLEI